MYWVNLFHSVFPSLPIWLTEFSCTQNSPTEAQEIQYMNDLLSRLDNASYVERLVIHKILKRKLIEPYIKIFMVHCASK